MKKNLMDIVPLEGSMIVAKVWLERVLSALRRVDGFDGEVGGW